MLGAHRLVGLAHVDGIVSVERGFQGVERRPPLFMASEEISEFGERRGLRVRRRGTLVGGVGRGGALRDHLVAVVRLGVVGRRGDPRVSQPVGRILGGDGDRCSRELFGVAKIRSHDSPGGFGQQLLRRFAFDLSANRRRSNAQGFG